MAKQFIHIYYRRIKFQKILHFTVVAVETTKPHHTQVVRVMELGEHFS